jgi:alanine-synthesizing transaminase
MLSDIESNKLKRIPPYIFGRVKKSIIEARRRGEDIIDFGMGNPDGATPKHIVDKLVEASLNPRNHRYSVSKGLPKLRSAICDWYRRKFGVELDPETEAIVTIGAKEGLSHLAPAILNPGDTVIVPSPTYPIHSYSVILCEGNVVSVPVRLGEDLFPELVKAVANTWPKPKALLLCYPHNPTTATVDLAFFERVVAFAKENGLIVIHDFAYAELVMDDYQAPSFLQVPRAKDVGVEFYTLSKTYNMPGWRVGFMVGNPRIVAALEKIKGYLDYGIFQPIQIASIAALNGPQDCVRDIVRNYQNRRDVLVDGLNKMGWQVEKPKATMFVWAKIPQKFEGMTSMDFAMKVLAEAKTAVSPGTGFGEAGEGYVRFALIENEERTRQALHGIKRMMGA